MTVGTLFSATLDSNGDGWNSITGVERIPASVMSLPNGIIKKLRFRFRAGTTQGFTITNVYVGHRAAAGDAYDFATTPTQILFGGNGSKVIAANTTETSDWIQFTYDKISDLLVSFYCAGGTSSDMLRLKAGVLSVTDYEKIANDAATVDKTGYSTNTDLLCLLDLIEYDVLDSFFALL